MCQIKIGAQLTDEIDLQNLITATILKEQEPYSIQELSLKVQDNCKGSTLNVSSEEISEKVRKTTMDFLRCDYLDCFEKKYFLKPPASIV